MLVASACGSEPIQPPAAEVSDVEPDPVTVAVLPPSYVAAPVVFNLRPVLAEIEAVVPKKFGSTAKEKRIQVMKGTPDVWVAPELTRAPFVFGFTDNTFTITTVLEYQAKAWAKALLAGKVIDAAEERAIREGLGRLELRLAAQPELLQHIAAIHVESDAIRRERQIAQIPASQRQTRSAGLDLKRFDGRSRNGNKIHRAWDGVWHGGRITRSGRFVVAGVRA
jgi:hypothetical protein